LHFKIFDYIIVVLEVHCAIYKSSYKISYWIHSLHKGKKESCIFDMRCTSGKVMGRFTLNMVTFQTTFLGQCVCLLALSMLMHAIRGSWNHLLLCSSCFIGWTIEKLQWHNIIQVFFEMYLVKHLLQNSSCTFIFKKIIIMLTIFALTK
jgi:hypothetical protein